MSDWISELQDRRLKEKADEEIQREKYKLAVLAAPLVTGLLMREIEGEVNEFEKRFGDDRVEIVSPTPTGPGVRVRILHFPLRVIEYEIHDAQIEYSKSHQKAIDARMNVERGTIFVKADFDGSRWFEHKGEKILTVPELSLILLKEVFEYASVL